MRINIYHHEVKMMANRTAEVVTKEAEGITYYGVRFYTEKPLMDGPNDDDSSAVTLWVPWDKVKGHSTGHLYNIANQLLSRCIEIDEAVERDKYWAEQHRKVAASLKTN